jgi:protein involved in polysaccharide export with SLBB domain
MTLSQLIGDAAGLKEDALMSRAVITRLNPDNSKASLSVNLQGVMNKSTPDVQLQREDSVYVASIFELRDKYTITINGSVRKPGKYAYADSTNVASLIIMAGGFTEGGTGKHIQVGRRITNSDPNSAKGKVAIVYNVDVDANLNLNNEDFVLKPYDIVSVYSLPGYETQRTVKVEGEVLYPGYYTLQNKDEKISDIVQRAGNLTALADPDGSSLKRTNAAILNVDKNKADSAALFKENAERQRRLHKLYRDSTEVDTQARNNYIGINLREIIKKPGSVTDLILEDGDVLRVPKQQQVVKVNGEVLYPSVVVYERSKSFRGFVLNAGGFSPQALKRGAYVVYPNGTVKGTRKFLFFNSFPEVKPGSEIYVPKKPPSRSNTTAELIGLTTGIASLGAIILGILSLHR